MRRNGVRIVFSVLLIGAGVLFLLQNLGFLRDAGGLFWALAFAVGGGAFLYVYLSDRTHWWAIIPGLTLLGIGEIIAVGTFLPQYDEILGAPVFMGFISLSFWIIYLTNRENWWAIIPGGVLLAIAIFIGLESLFPGVEMVGVFFLGLGLTFLLLAYLPTQEGRMRWALIPAGVLLLMGVIFMGSAFSALEIIGPAVLVLAGLYLIFRTFRPKGEIQP
ncbi:MAG TPA: hypothetical protein G4O11_08045 [Anaerolineae bacterium]|nr:hypothetical protein [Anaerolineae bacterium]